MELLVHCSNRPWVQNGHTVLGEGSEEHRRILLLLSNIPLSDLIERTSFGQRTTSTTPPTNNSGPGIHSLNNQNYPARQSPYLDLDPNPARRLATCRDFNEGRDGHADISFYPQGRIHACSSCGEQHSQHTRKSNGGLIICGYVNAGERGHAKGTSSPAGRFPAGPVGTHIHSTTTIHKRERPKAAAKGSTK
jgi:hypothetical protein